MDTHSLLQRMSIIGTTGSGKTTLAHQLSQVLQIPHIELDAIHWERGDWTPIDPDAFQARVAEAVRAQHWVIEGGYSVVRDAIWTRAETVVWLDYSLPLTFARLVRRTARRLVSPTPLWGGSRETLSRTLSRDSILLWCLTSYGRKKRQFPSELTRPEYAHLRVLRFRSPRQTAAWLAALKTPSPS